MLSCSGPLSLWIALTFVLSGPWVALALSLSLARHSALPQAPPTPTCAPWPSFSRTVCTPSRAPFLSALATWNPGAVIPLFLAPSLSLVRPPSRVLPAHPPSCSAYPPSLARPHSLALTSSRALPLPLALPLILALPLTLALPLVLVQPPLVLSPASLARTPTLRFPSPSRSPSPLSRPLTLLSHTIPFVPTPSPALFSRAPSHPLHLAREGGSRGEQVGWGVRGGGGGAGRGGKMVDK